MHCIRWKSPIHWSIVAEDASKETDIHKLSKVVGKQFHRQTIPSRLSRINDDNLFNNIFVYSQVLFQWIVVMAQCRGGKTCPLLNTLRLFCSIIRLVNGRTHFRLGEISSVGSRLAFQCPIKKCYMLSKAKDK